MYKKRIESKMIDSGITIPDEVFVEEEPKKSYWWIWLLLLFLLFSGIMIGFWNRDYIVNKFFSSNYSVVEIIEPVQEELSVSLTNIEEPMIWVEEEIEEPEIEEVIIEEDFDEESLFIEKEEDTEDETEFDSFIEEIDDPEEDLDFLEVEGDLDELELPSTGGGLW